MRDAFEHDRGAALLRKLRGLARQRDPQGEYDLDIEFADADTAMKAAAHVIEVYNNFRIHESLGYITPVQARREPILARNRIVAIQKVSQARRKDSEEKRLAALKKAKEAA